MPVLLCIRVSFMPNDLIRYDLLVQEALCGVVSRVLADVARNGLPGDHHFYITFRTHAPGVRLSSRMREQYPDEMTIILQHQFEDLKVTDHGFEVGLSFKGIPEILLIPFDALTGFFDPSVQFSLKFEPQTEEERDAEPLKPEVTKPASIAMLPQPVRSGLPAPAPPTAPQQPDQTAEKPGKGGVAKSAEVADEAKVVSIDAFRKKP